MSNRLFILGAALTMVGALLITVYQNYLWGNVALGVSNFFLGMVLYDIGREFFRNLLTPTDANPTE